MGNITENMEFRGDVSITGNFYPPSGSITTSHITGDTTARIVATKLEHQFACGAVALGTTDTVVAGERIMHAVYGATGEIVAFEGVVSTVATGTDRTVTVNLLRASSGSTYATVLSSNIQFTSTSAARTPVAATLSTTALVDGDVLKASWTVAGSSLAQAIGLYLNLILREDPS